MSDAKPTRFDPRTYIALDHGMPENPKVVGLSDKAFRMYVESICYSSRQQSDGLIPRAALRRLGSEKSADELAKAGLWEKSGAGWAVHDYLLHNRSSVEIEAMREHRSDNGGRGAHTRWHVARRKYDAACVFCNPDVTGGQAPGG